MKANVTRIRLARSLPRLLAVPVAIGIAGAAAVAAGLALSSNALGLVLIGLGAAVLVAGIVAAVMLLSVRLDVEESAVRLSWLGGSRRFVLVPGPVTRVPLRGPRASKLRPRLGAIGWGIGSARLRDEEEIELIRLAPTETAILIPTEDGRVAIAAAREDELLEALARAAQARQRPVAAPPPPPRSTGLESPAPEAAQPDAGIDVEPTSLTGIERALLEERLARERADAERAARDARIAAAAAAEAEAAAAAEAAIAEAPAPITQPARRRALPSPLRPRTSWALVLAPTLVAAATWWIGREIGAMPPAGSDLARLTSLALVLAGPATSIGAAMALAWWPRIVGVVVAGGLAASVLIGRSLVG